MFAGVSVKSGIPRRWQWHQYQLAETLIPREEIACDRRKIVAVFGESVSASVYVWAS